MLLVGTHLQLSFAPVGLVSAPCFVSSAVLHPAQQKLVVPFVSLAFVLSRYAACRNGRTHAGAQQASRMQLWSSQRLKQSFTVSENSFPPGRAKPVLTWELDYDSALHLSRFSVIFIRWKPAILKK